ncbi:MAG: phosphate ABC transporter substrate-binding protein [Leptospiraceae bacterium]|nr:phosphate ABC transporter substrate-binding protein [Leptospiraceae bacterium]
MKRFQILTMAAVMSFAAACGKKDASLKIAGSDTMVQLGQNLVKAYMQANPGKSASVQGGGSGTGIAGLLNGSTDIASASREMKPKEWDQAKAKGLDIKEYVIALDALAVVVHPANKVAKLTIAQLSDIYAGKITNWKQVGGADQEILVISRENNSGTHVYFKEHVLRQGKEAKKGETNADPLASLEFGAKITYGVSSQAISDQVKSNPAAIGYFGMGWITKDVKPLEISKDGKAYYAPTSENTSGKKYPIARGLQMYVNQAAGEKAQKFIDFVMGPEGQKVIKAQDFVPVK